MEDLKTDEYYKELVDDFLTYNIINKYESESIEEPNKTWFVNQPNDGQDYQDDHDWRLKWEVNERITKLIFDREAGQLSRIKRAYLLGGGENKK